MKSTFDFSFRCTKKYVAQANHKTGQVVVYLPKFFGYWSLVETLPTLLPHEYSHLVYGYHNERHWPHDSHYLEHAIEAMTGGDDC